MRWCPEQVERLHALYPRYRIRHVATLMGLKAETCRSAISRFGFGNRKYWSEEEIARLRLLYPNTSNPELAKQFGRTRHAIDSAGRAFGLAKTPAHIAAHARLQKGARIGVEHQFKKGTVPANKGLRRPGFAPGRMRETQFKKGSRSGIAERNWKPIGTVLPDPEGYLRIKVREAVHGVEATGFGNARVWPLLGRHVWEQHNGPIPPGHVIAFKDRDRNNCTIENLESISRAEMARRNRMWGRLPQELAEVIHLNGVLKRKVRRLSGEKQNV